MLLFIGVHIVLNNFSLDNRYVTVLYNIDIYHTVYEVSIEVFIIQLFKRNTVHQISISLKILKLSYQ